jgi:hypothetical protein
MAKKDEKLRPARNPLVPKLNDHKNQAFKDKKKEKDKNICREKVKSDETS